MIRSAKVFILVLGAFVLMEGAAGCASWQRAMTAGTGSHRSPRGGCRVVAGGELDPDFNFFNESVEGIGVIDYRRINSRMGETTITLPDGKVVVVGWSATETSAVWNEPKCVPHSTVACEDFDGNGSVECVDGLTGKQVGR